MPNFEDVQSDNVVDRSDAISDPTDMSSLWRGTRSFSPQEAAINIGKWYNKVTGNGPPDQMPEGSMSADAGYNAIGKGYDDGGEVTGLPPNSDTNTTDETPSSMDDVTGSIGATGTQGQNDQQQSDAGGFKPMVSSTGVTQAGPHGITSEDVNAVKDFFSKPLAGNLQLGGQQKDTLGQDILNGAANTLPGQYGTVAKKLAQELIAYAQQKYQGDPAGELHGQTMDHQTAEVLGSTVNKDGSLPDESKKALEYAFNKGGPEPGLSFLQNRIGVWDTTRAWAAAAYDGGNIQASVDGMNKAIRALPLDEHVQFAVGNNGTVTATVVQPDGDNPVHFSLTGSQFRELARGGTGFAYNMINDPSAMLAQLVNTNHDLWAPPTSQGVKPSQAAGVVPDSYKTMGVNQAMWNISMEMFPSVGQNQQRLQFLMGQVATKQKYEQELAQKKAEGANRLNYAQEMNRGREQVAETNVAGREKVEGMRGETQRYNTDQRKLGYDTRSYLTAQSRLEDAQIRQQIASQNVPVKLASNILGNVGRGTMTEDQADAILKKGGTSLSQLMELLKPQQAPTQAPQVQGGPGAAQVAQSKGGTWTFPGGKPDPKKPNGGAVWTPSQ